MHIATTKKTTPTKSATNRGGFYVGKFVAAFALLSTCPPLCCGGGATLTGDSPPRRPGQRELRYVVQEELVVGTDIADVADDAGLVSRYGPEVARSSLRFRFLATPRRVPVAVDEITGRIRTTGRLDREAICGDGGDRMELCLNRLDVAVQPMNYFQIIKVCLQRLCVLDWTVTVVHDRFQ